MPDGDRKLLLFFVGYAITMGTNGITSFLSFRFVSASLVVMIGSTAPVFALGLSRIFLGLNMSFGKVKQFFCGHRRHRYMYK